MAVDTAGAVLSKADRMAAIKGNKLGPAPPESDLKFRVYGDTVIITNVQNRSNCGRPRAVYEHLGETEWNVEGGQRPPDIGGKEALRQAHRPRGCGRIVQHLIDPTRRGC